MEESRYWITYRERGSRFMGQKAITCPAESGADDALVRFDLENPTFEALVAIPLDNFRA